MDELKKKYSDKLEQEISFNPRTGVVYCSDGVQYTPQEMAIIKTMADSSAGKESIIICVSVAVGYWQALTSFFAGRAFVPLNGFEIIRPLLFTRLSR